MISRRHLLTAAAAATAAACSRPRKHLGYPGYAFVANSDGKAVAAVDLSVFAVARHIALDADPVQVLNHPSRKAVFALAPANGTIYEIHPEKLEVSRQVRLGATPSHMKLSSDGQWLWALCPPQRLLVRVSAHDFSRSLRVPLPAEPADFDPAPADGDAARGLVAVSLREPGQVRVFDAEAGREAWSAAAGATAGAVAFRRDGKILLVAVPGAQALRLIDTASHRVAADLPLAVRPDRLCMKDDGGQVFVAGEGMDAVVTVYPYQTEVANTMLAGRNPGFLAASADHLLVANPQSNNVTIVSVASQKVMAVATVGREPAFIALTPGGEFALVLNRESGDIAVLHVATVQSRRLRSAPVVTMIPVGSRPVSAVIRDV